MSKDRNQGNREKIPSEIFSFSGHYEITIPYPPPELAKKLNESIRSVFNSYALSNETLKAMSEAAQAFYSSYAPIAEALQEMRQRFNESIKPILANLASLYADIDWEKLADGSRKWGEFGWIPPEGMGLRQICNPPEALLDADKIALSYIDKEAVDGLEHRLLQIVPKKSDMQEALNLFNERRYKPAAMMICSLIECELIKTQDHSDWRKPEKAIRKFNSEIPEEGIIVVTEAALIGAYEYFFKNGDNFNHGIEGELNRNFLQHGMMYKPVRRKTCIKLLLILQEVATKTCL